MESLSLFGTGSVMVVGLGATTLLLALLFIIKLVQQRRSAEQPALESQEETHLSEKTPDAQTPQAQTPQVQPREKIPLEVKEASYKTALSSTRSGFWGRLAKLFESENSGWREVREQFEETLLTSDLGPRTATQLLEKLDQNLSHAKAQGRELEALANQSLRAELKSMLNRPAAHAEVGTELGFKPGGDRLNVILIVGVNGAGKTTTIGKLAAAHAAKGFNVMVAAGDTFRAAAASQLALWAERAQASGRVEIFEAPGITDPSAVAYQAHEKAGAKNCDLLIVDTAGRLHTSRELMEELKKVQRVLKKRDASAPHETLLVLDANMGQNALNQAHEFTAAVQCSGVVLTKLDGSAKGGVAFGVASELKLPIRFVGLGEGLNDLKVFNADEFVDAIVPAEKQLENIEHRIKDIETVN